VGARTLRTETDKARELFEPSVLFMEGPKLKEYAHLMPYDMARVHHEKW
jgi:hypothetical protein